MAIPFNFPSDEETESQYRSMDDLIAQLCNVLRQIWLHPRTPLPPPVIEQINVQRTNGQTTAATERLDDHVAVLPDVIPIESRLAEVSHPSQTPQPDLVASLPSRPSRRRDASTATSSNPLPPPRRGRRRRAQRPRAEDNACAPAAKGGVKETVFECHTYTTYQPERKVEVRDNWTQVGEDLRRIADDFQTSIESLDHKPLVDPANPKSMSSLLSLLAPTRPYTGSIWMTVIFILGWGVLQRAR